MRHRDLDKSKLDPDLSVDPKERGAWVGIQWKRVPGVGIQWKRVSGVGIQWKGVPGYVGIQ